MTYLKIDPCLTNEIMKQRNLFLSTGDLSKNKKKGKQKHKILKKKNKARIISKNYPELWIGSGMESSFL